jgi:hypothetical protein
LSHGPAAGLDDGPVSDDPFSTIASPPTNCWPRSVLHFNVPVLASNACRAAGAVLVASAKANNVVLSADQTGTSITPSFVHSVTPVVVSTIHAPGAGLMGVFERA